jgi:pimeloyl-ACP methyl ester carboxylesterase
MTPAPQAGRVETLNETPLYFEVHGTGEPVMLLHGFSGSSKNWSAAIETFRSRFQLVVPDLRGHGRSGTLTKPFRHKDTAADMLALLDHLHISTINGIGISGGGNVLLHMAAMRRSRIGSMVLVSATPYFPVQARLIMRQYADSLPDEQRVVLRQSHPGGDPQIDALLSSTRAFADSYDDMDFTPPLLSTIQARTLIVQGDRDP